MANNRIGASGQSPYANVDCRVRLAGRLLLRVAALDDEALRPVVAESRGSQYSLIADDGKYGQVGEGLLCGASSTGSRRPGPDGRRHTPSCPEAAVRSVIRCHVVASNDIMMPPLPTRRLDDEEPGQFTLD
jgi:hypothetical protein